MGSIRYRGRLPQVSSDAMNLETRGLAPSMLDGAPAFIGMCDDQFRPTYLNPAGRELVCFPEATELTAVKVSDFFIVEHRKLIDTVGLPTMAREGHWEQDLRFRDWQDPRHELDVRCSIFGLYDEHRNFLAGVTITQEIKSRNRAEAAVRDGRALVQSVLDRLPLGVGVFDATGRLMHSNEHWRRRGVFSLPTRSPTASQRWKRSEGSDGARALREPGVRALKGESVPEADVLQSVGEAAPGWVRISAAPLAAEGARPDGAVLVAQDVDALHRLQARLARSEALLSVATEATGLGMFTFDAATGIFEWDERLRRLWGVGPDRAVDWHLLYTVIHPEDASRVRATIGSCMRTQQSRVITVKYRVIRQDDGRVQRMSTGLRSIFEDSVLTAVIGATAAVVVTQ